MTAQSPFDGVPADTAAALRAELRPDERVTFASVPLSAHDAGDLGARLRNWLIPVELVILALVLIGDAIMIVLGELQARHWLPSVVTPAVLTLLMLDQYFRARTDRRKAAGSVYAVTDQRVIVLATWPERSVLTIEPRDIEEVYCWTVSPACGNVRFRAGLRSTDANALMHVPDPRACAAAMSALLSAPE